MKIIEETPDRLVFHQGKNLWGYFAGSIFLLASVGMIYAFWFHPTQQTDTAYFFLTGIGIVTCMIFGSFGIFFSGKSMTVVFDKVNSLIQSSTSSKPASKDVGAILRQDGPGIIRFDDIAKVAWVTSTIGVVLKSGERVQFGTGGVNAYRKAFFAHKLSDFMNIPIEESNVGQVINSIKGL